MEAIGTIETIMEHIAKVTGKNPEDVRKVNMTKDHPCINMIDEVKALADYDNRVKTVESFNKVTAFFKKTKTYLFI